MKNGSYPIKFFTLVSTLEVAFLAFALVALSFWLQGNIGINLADEGYYWYGALRTLLGDFPIRDFQSYDPGRYYWAAFWLKLLGDGIISLRIATGFFQFVGLTFGLLALRRVVRPWWALAMLGLLLMVWMYPRHKIFESSIAMAAVYFAVILMENPSLRRHFVAGIFIGVAAIFGRNHGLYGSMSFFLLILFVWYKIDRDNLIKKIVSWLAGILVGYLPMLVMFILVPGFYDSFVESIRFLFCIGGTNLPFPIPWPWKVDYSHLALADVAKTFSLGMLFLLLPTFYTFMVIHLIGSKGNTLQNKSLLAATVFVGIMYMHHAFSRADLNHLAQSIHPLLIGILTLPFIFKNRYHKVVSAGFIIIISVMSYYTILSVSPYYLKATAPYDAYLKINILGDHIWVDRSTANLISTVQQINKYVQPGEELLIAPYWPSFYPILQRESPLREIYFIFGETEENQGKMILKLKEENVNWAILGDDPIDGRDDLRFKNRYHLLWQYIMNNFESVTINGLPGNYQLLHKKNK